MNAKWLQQFLVYKESVHNTTTAIIIVNAKMREQYACARFFNISLLSPALQELSTDKEKMLLDEARYAHAYWKEIRKKLSTKTISVKRDRYGDDPMNKLLNVGYHYLANVIQKKCQQHDIPTELGIFHIAQSARAQPLVYDLMEPWRPLIIDRILVHFFSLKKNFKEILDEKDIPKFLARIKKNLQKKYFYTKLGYGITLDYWIDLYLLEFRKAVSTQKTFTLYLPSWRHENRCKQKANKVG